MPRPLAVRRHDEIVRRLRAAGTVSVGELAEGFGVSHETIRRDLKALADQGHLDVVHGGAARRGVMEPALSQREAENAAGKAAIARAATKLVPENGTVLLDSGSTTHAIVLELVARRGLTLCTNSLSHAAALCRVPGNRVYLLGGEVDGNDEATIGIDVMAAVANFRVDVAFVGIGGFAEDGGATDYSRGAAEMRGRMLISGRAYVVADRSKFTRRTPFRIPNFDRCTGIIVDAAPDETLAAAWDERGLTVIAADQP
jgi:DeoR family transcriptional regulator, glycerol-3-phosphate regulon repressor